MDLVAASKIVTYEPKPTESLGFDDSQVFTPRFNPSSHSEKETENEAKPKLF